MTTPVTGSMNGVRTVPRERPVDPRLQEAAEGMEAQFLDQMIRAMRQTVPEGGLLDKSQTEEVFQGMLDSEYAQRMSKAGGIGLSRLIVEHLSKSQ